MPELKIINAIALAAALLLAACGTGGEPGSITAHAGGRAGFYMGGGL